MNKEMKGIYFGADITGSGGAVVVTHLGGKEYKVAEINDKKGKPASFTFTDRGWNGVILHLEKNQRVSPGDSFSQLLGGQMVIFNGTLYQRVTFNGEIIPKRS